jgi:hypothetical protein
MESKLEKNGQKSMSIFLDVSLNQALNQELLVQAQV